MSQCEGAIWSWTAGESTELPEGTTGQREARGAVSPSGSATWELWTRCIL